MPRVIHQNARPDIDRNRDVWSRRAVPVVPAYRAGSGAEAPGRSSSTISSTGNSGAIRATGNSTGGLSIGSSQTMNASVQHHSGSGAARDISQNAAAMTSSVTS